MAMSIRCRCLAGLLVVSLSTPVLADAVFLKNGNILDGTVVVQTKDLVVLKTPNGAMLRFSLRDVKEVRNERNAFTSEPQEPTTTEAAAPEGRVADTGSSSQASKAENKAQSVGGAAGEKKPQPAQEEKPAPQAAVLSSESLDLLQSSISAMTENSKQLAELGLLEEEQVKRQTRTAEEIILQLRSQSSPATSSSSFIDSVLRQSPAAAGGQSAGATFSQLQMIEAQLKQRTAALEALNGMR